jgi:hypothetical protein
VSPRVLPQLLLVVALELAVLTRVGQFVSLQVRGPLRCVSTLTHERPGACVFACVLAEAVQRAARFRARFAQVRARKRVRLHMAHQLRVAWEAPLALLTGVPHGLWYAGNIRGVIPNGPHSAGWVDFQRSMAPHPYTQHCAGWVDFQRSMATHTHTHTHPQPTHNPPTTHPQPTHNPACRAVSQHNAPCVSTRAAQ